MVDLLARITFKASKQVIIMNATKVQWFHSINGQDFRHRVASSGSSEVELPVTNRKDVKRTKRNRTHIFYGSLAAYMKSNVVSTV